MLRAQSISLSTTGWGWAGAGLLGLGFAILFLLNYLVPLDAPSYALRLWDWAELSLAALALAVVVWQRRAVTLRAVLVGAGLGLLSAWSRTAHSPGLAGAVQQAAAVCLSFMGGSVLFARLRARRVAAFYGLPASILSGLGLGILFALPLAVVNNLFFYLQNGPPRFESLPGSAFAALSPGIHEEALYRYFIMAMVFYLLQDSPRPRLVLTAALVLAVVPHSLLHLPDLFLQDPGMAVFMLAATSLLFGLPMALLQVWKSFESAAAFHWLIDFARFWFGY